MVQALLDNRKFMTRRTKGLELINKNPSLYRYDSADDSYGDYDNREPDKTLHWFERLDEKGKELEKYDTIKCPYGQIGDVLWVRETYYAYGKWELSGKTKTGKQKWDFKDLTFWNKNMPDGGYKYADNPPSNIQNGKSTVEGYYKRPSLFMPKAACRIFLEITEIWVERLNDISEEDAIREGVLLHERGIHWLDYIQQKHKITQFIYCLSSAKQSFKTLWNLINGEDIFPNKFSWNKNPWVWVISFKRIDKPSDFK